MIMPFLHISEVPPYSYGALPWTRSCLLYRLTWRMYYIREKKKKKKTLNMPSARL